MDPKISVIVPVFNIIPRKQFLLPTLRSVYSQTLVKQIKVYLVDDGSSDGTSEYIQNLSKDEFPNLEIVLLPQNVGKHQLLNQIVTKYVSTDYFVILDSDDLLMPTAIEKMLKLMESNETLSCVKTGLAVLSRGQIRVKSIVPQNPIFYRYYIHNFGAFIGNTGSLWKTAVFKTTIREFDPNTEIGKLSRLTCEDGLRLYLMDPKDWNFDAVDEPLLIYRMHDLQWTADKTNMSRCDGLLDSLFRSKLNPQQLLINPEDIFDEKNLHSINKHLYNHLLSCLIVLWKKREWTLFVDELRLFFRGIPKMPWLYYVVLVWMFILLLRHPRSLGYQILEKLRWWFPRLLMAEIKISKLESKNFNHGSEIFY